ncbi:4195_t:CDS:2, partial [Gigaspora margarita]
QLSKMAKVINARKANNEFENAFVTQHKSMYANKDHLTLLTKKAEVFLLRQMPLGFSSDYFPSSNACDYCYEQFDGTDSNLNLVESLEANETNNLESQILDENDILEKLEKNKNTLHYL